MRGSRAAGGGGADGGGDVWATPEVDETERPRRGAAPTVIPAAGWHAGRSADRLRTKAADQTPDRFRNRACLTLSPPPPPSALVFQMYSEMAGRRRARPRSIQIIRTATISDDEVKRVNMLQYVGGNVKFPLPHRIVRAPSKKLRTTYKASRPETHFN